MTPRRNLEAKEKNVILNPQEKEAREALRIACEVNEHIHEHSSWCQFCKKIAAALLDARANGMQTVVDGTKGGNFWSVGAQRLRAEAQQLRGKGE